MNIKDRFINKKLLRGDKKRRPPQFDIPPKEKWLDLFLSEEYGVRPPECDLPLRYEKIEEKAYKNAVGEKYFMYYGALKMEFHLWLPDSAAAPLKCFCLPLHPSAYRDKTIWETPERISDYCPIDLVTDRRYAVAILLCGTVANDEKGGEYSGIFKEMNYQRTPDGWGVLSAWAWATSKIVDMLENDPRFDKNGFAVIGHSRGGKTALLAGATDKRFSFVVSNNSGCSGAALSRGKKGERIADIVRVFPYWFCENYKKYANNESALPFDQFMLIALIAPRKCYVTSATRDAWADPVAELMSARLASPYFEQAGVKGLIAPDVIEPDVAYDRGNLAYRRRIGVHELCPDDWRNYMDYFK